jgi:hypothetical protein
MYCIYSGSLGTNYIICKYDEFLNIFAKKKCVKEKNRDYLGILKNISLVKMELWKLIIDSKKHVLKLPRYYGILFWI